MFHLPKEVVNHIYEYSPEHRPAYSQCMVRVKLSKVLRQIRVKGTLSRIKHIERSFDRQVSDIGDWDLESLVKRQIQDPEYIVKYLSKCRCCKRHQKYKPKNLSNTLIDTTELCKYNVLRGCRCSCRHYSRFINGAFTNRLSCSIPFSSKWAEENSNLELIDDDY